MQSGRGAGYKLNNNLMTEDWEAQRGEYSCVQSYVCVTVQLSLRVQGHVFAEGDYGFFLNKDRFYFYFVSPCFCAEWGKQRCSLRVAVTFHPVIILAPSVKQPLPSLQWSYLNWQELMRWPYRLSTGEKKNQFFHYETGKIREQLCIVLLVFYHVLFIDLHIHIIKTVKSCDKFSKR